LVAEIAAASNEQSQGVGEISQGLTQIESVVQQNTANAEESAAASEELASQAGHLSQMLAKFKLKGRQIGNQMSITERETDINNSSYHIENSSRQNKDDKEVASEPLIALDDSDFGKY
jgi:methyl-accepting chemotaxis protein